MSVFVAGTKNGSGALRDPIARKLSAYLKLKHADWLSYAAQFTQGERETLSHVTPRPATM